MQNRPPPPPQQQMQQQQQAPVALQAAAAIAQGYQYATMQPMPMAPFAYMPAQGGYTIQAAPPQQQQQVMAPRPAGPAPPAQASSSSGFAQHLTMAQSAAPAAPQSQLARLIFTAKCSAALDALPDDEVKRLFTVMYEKFPTTVVTTQVQGKMEQLQKRREDLLRETQRKSKQVEEQIASVFALETLVDDDDD
jgi:hypothetical protein